MADAGSVTPAAPAEPRHAVHGCLGLAFAHRNGHTALVRQVSRSPLHVQGVLHGVGPGAEVVVLNVAGNVLGGDVLDLEVAAGDKIPRKGGPGIVRSDLLVINKIDLAPHVGASLEVMERDARRARGERPLVFSNLRSGEGVDGIVSHVRAWLAQVGAPAGATQ